MLGGSDGRGVSLVLPEAQRADLLISAIDTHLSPTSQQAPGEVSRAVVGCRRPWPSRRAWVPLWAASAH